MVRAIDRLEKALNFQETDRPPHFELKFELQEEAFGMEFPSHEELCKATGKEREKLYGVCAEIYARTVERFKWDAVGVWHPGSRDEIQYDFIPFLKKHIGDDIPVFSYLWESFVSLETVKDYMEFSIKLAEEPEEIHKWAASMLQDAKEHVRNLIDAGVYGIIIANDSAFNDGPFLSPSQHAEFCAPYVRKLIEEVRSRGARTGYHTDGNLMKIMDQIIDIKPDFLHSIDPMAKMDIKSLKELTYGKITLMGNVQCNFLQDGPAEDIVGSAQYCLDHATKGGGYIFSTSNTIFKGMPLHNYELMMDYYWKRFNA